MRAEVDLPEEQRKVLRNGLLGTVACVAVLAAAYVGLFQFFVFPDDRTGAIDLALQADLFVLAWVVIGVRLVSRGRLRSRADINGSAYAPSSPRIVVEAAFLQNTLEQAVIAVGAHLVLATLLKGESLALIPGAVLLFVVGRVTFLAGYRSGAGERAFGMVVTMAPTIAAYLLAATLIVAKLV